MVVIGNVSPTDVVGDEHEIKMLTNSYAPLQVSFDADGKIWLIVGTGSRFRVSRLVLHQDLLPDTHRRDRHRHDYLSLTDHADS